MIVEELLWSFCLFLLEVAIDERFLCAFIVGLVVEVIGREKRIELLFAVYEPGAKPQPVEDFCTLSG